MPASLGFSMATRTRPEPLSAEQREIVREAARYADSWVALRARTQRVPGVQVAVAVAGDVLLSSAHGFARLPGTNADGRRRRAADDRASVPDRLPLQDVHGDGGHAARRGRASCGSTTPSSEHVAALAGSPIGDRTLAELLAHGGGVVRDSRRGRLLAAAAGVPRQRGAGRGLPRRRRRARAERAVQVLQHRLRRAGSRGRGGQRSVVPRLRARARRRSARPARHRARARPVPVGRVRDRATRASRRTSRRLPIDPVDTRALASATGFWSTAEDLCRYAAGHVLGDERLLSDASKRRMQRGEWDIEGTDDRYGLGFGHPQDRRAPDDRPRRRLPRSHHPHAVSIPSTA